MLDLYAEKNKLVVREKETITSGSVNVYPMKFEFSNDWDGLRKTVMFQAGDVEKSVSLTGGVCTVPAEVLTMAGHYLMVGVCGKADGLTVLPTTWATLGLIREGAVPGDIQTPNPPTEDWEEALRGKGDNLSLVGRILALRSGETVLSDVELPPAGETIAYNFGHGLNQNGLDITVNAVSDFSGDNTLPMTAEGVQTQVGNIEALLATI